MKKFLNDITLMARDRAFLSKTVRIAIPAAVQVMLNTIVNMVDTMMIGSLGSSAIAAVGLANKVFFVMNLLVFGIVSGSCILASQFWGNQDVKNIRKVLGLALMMAVGGSFLFVVPAAFFPEYTMRIFTSSRDAVRIGASYLRVAAFTYPLIAASTAYVFLLRSVGQVREPVLISTMAIAVNIVLNFVFIYGMGPVPAMGVVGAAAATLIARIIELVSLVSMVYLKKTVFACSFREMYGYSGVFIRRFFSTAAPVIANEFMWGLGVTMYSLAYGRMGDDPMAAITVATTIQDIMSVLFQGLGAAVAVILGNEMGAGDLKKAERDAASYLALQFLLSVAVGILCMATRYQVIALYRVTGTVAADVSRCLIIFSVMLPVKMYNYALIVGILRSGGDTRYCLFLDASGVWLIGIPMAFLGGLFFKFPIWAVYAMVLLEEVYKAVLGAFRYRKKKWLRNLTREIGQ